MMMTESCSVCSEPLAGDVCYRQGGDPAHVACAQTAVFVYGSLRAPRAWAWRDTHRIDAQVAGYALHAYTGSYPVMLPSDDTSVVHGEVVFVDHDDKSAMHDLAIVRATEEGAGYTATTVKATLIDGSRLDVEAWVFTADFPPGERIEHGDWRKWEFTHRPVVVTPPASKQVATLVDDDWRPTTDDPWVECEHCLMLVPFDRDYCCECGEPFDDDDIEERDADAGDMVDDTVAVWRKISGHRAKWEIEYCGEIVWTGSSLTAMAHYAKENGLTLVKETQQEQK